MGLFDVLSMIGGLALFLYGMSLLGEGLSKVSGGRMEKIMEKLTSNPVQAVLLGAGVTVAVQSSSATTVMVVGFVNSGIMKLSQAVGIIMGANIGTTVTSWILSLSGIESSNFFIRLLQPSSFSPVLALIGMAVIMFSKSQKKKNIAIVLIGFAILMFGMDTMREGAKLLADIPEFADALTAAGHPVSGLIVGTLLTVLLKSSSASIGILQALCATGAVTYGFSIPIILGQNIGSCVAAILSGIGASKNARRAALIHLYFNAIGALILMFIFYSVNAFVSFSFLKSVVSPVGIAMVHSIFNIASTVILLPFSRALERLACFTIRGDQNTELSEEETADLQYLDVRFLDQPSFAIRQAKTVAVHMAEMAQRGLYTAMTLINHYKEEQANLVAVLERNVDHYEDQLGSYLVKLSGRDLSQKDSCTLSLLLHCIGDFERISDHAVNVMKAAKEIQEKEMFFSEKAEHELNIYMNAVSEIVNTAVRVFREENHSLAKEIEPLEEVIDGMREELKKRHIRRLRKGTCTIDMGFVLSDLTTNFERVADHCSNIAVCLLELKDEGLDVHEYLEILRQSKDRDFQEKLMKFAKKYNLP